METILNHSIESDNRILQFTNDVFPTDVSSIMKVEDRPSDLTKPRMVNIAVQCDKGLVSLKQCCIADRGLVVLEADLPCLRAATSGCVNGWIRELIPYVISTLNNRVSN